MCYADGTEERSKVTNFERSILLNETFGELAH